MLKLHYIIWGFLAVAVACKAKEEPSVNANEKSSAPKGPGYEAIVASNVALTNNIEVPGTIMAGETTNIQSEISGKVVAINFREGSSVSKGTVLIKLFDEDLQAQLKKLEVQLKIGQETEKRQKELLEINGTSRQEFDNAALITANIQADIELLKVSISRTAIRAPFSGKIGLRNISLGAYITPATIITNISEVNVLKVEFSVPEKYTGLVAVGNDLNLALNGNAKPYKAKIFAIQNSISIDSRNLIARAQITNADPQIVPGAFANVKLALSKAQDVIMIPTQAVIPTTRHKQVIVLEGGKAVFKNINTGIRDSARVEVIDGLKTGDTVITTGLLSIKAGQDLKVKVINK